MHFHQGFCESFGVDDKGVSCTFGLVFILELAGLCVGVNHKARTAGGDGGNEGAGAAFVRFEVSAGAGVVRCDGIGDPGNFHDFGWEDVLVDWES